MDTTSSKSTSRPTRYYFDLVCPKCGKRSETYQDNSDAEPNVNCGDCLMNTVEVVKMTVTQMTEIK